MGPRVLSALLFGGAAALVTLGVLGSLVGLTDTTVAGWALAAIPVLYALPFVVAGVLAGPRAARSPGPGQAIIVGCVAVVVGIVLLAAAALAWMVVGELTGGRPNLRLLDWEDLPLLVVAVLAMGAACSPIGGLCGYAVWRRLGGGAEYHP